MPNTNVAIVGIVYGSMFLREAESNVNLWVGRFSVTLLVVIGPWFLCAPVLTFVFFTNTVPSPTAARITSRHIESSGDSRNTFKVAVVPFLCSVCDIQIGGGF